MNLNNIRSQTSCFPMPPPPGVYHTGKLYTTGEKFKPLLGDFFTLMEESPGLASRDDKNLMKVKVELDGNNVGAIMNSLCFTQGMPVSYLKDKESGTTLTFTALYNQPMKLIYMGEKKESENTLN